MRTDQGRSEAATEPAEGGGWVLRGVAVSERGEPVTGVTVSLVGGVSSAWDRLEARHLLRKRPAYGSAQTDARGRFLIRLPASPAASQLAWWMEEPGLLCDPPGCRPALKPLPESFHAHGGSSDLVLRSGTCLTGRVLAPDGAPAAYCRLTIGHGAMWSTDEQGRFRAPAPGPDEFDLRLASELGVLRLTGLRAPPAEDLALGDLVLRGSGRLAGRLILPDGSPAPHVRVSFAARNQSDLPRIGRWSDEGRLVAATMTGPDGSFHVQGLTLDEHAPVCLAMNAEIPLHPQGLPAEGTSWLRAGPESDGHLLVLPWRMLLLDVPEYGEGMQSLIYEVHGSAAAASEAPDHTTFRQLDFGIVNPRDLPLVLLYDSATWIRISAVAGTQATGNALIPVAPEPWLTRASMALEPAAPTGRIVVRATDSAGEPVRRLKVELRDPLTGLAVLGAWPHSVTGSAEFRNAPVGVWALHMSSASEDFDNYAQPETVTVEVRAGDVREIDWRPRSGGRLQIVVNLGGSTALPADPPAIRATVLDGPGHVGNLLNLVEDGKQRQRAPKPSFPPATVMVVAGVLEPGTYRIRFNADGYAPAEGSVEVLAADIARLVARLDAAF